MKKFIFFGLLAALTGCSTGTDTDTKNTDDPGGQLAGTYFKSKTDPRGTVQYTVIIEAMPGANTYQVKIKNVIDKIWDGKKMPTQTEAPPPKLATFDPQHSTLLIDGVAAYSVDLQAGTITKGKVTLPKQP